MTPLPIHHSLTPFALRPQEAYHYATPVGDRGMPGFSDNERARFKACVAGGELVDVWRLLHPLPTGGGKQTNAAAADADLDPDAAAAAAAASAAAAQLATTAQRGDSEGPTVTWRGAEGNNAGGFRGR